MSQSKGGGDGESKSRMKTGGERVGEREGGRGAGRKREIIQLQYRNLTKRYMNDNS